MTSPQARRSGFSRLRNLPEVLTMPFICRSEGWSAAQASVYIANWQKQGFLRRAGPRSGIYYNLVTFPFHDEMRFVALRTLYPSAILMGESVLHAAGWITQIPQSQSVAVLTRPSFAKLDGFILHPRPLRWFRQHADALVSPDLAEFSTYGLKALPPEHALLDLYSDPQAWHPDPDDLHLESEHLAAIASAAEAAAGSLPPWLADLLPTRPRKPGL
jgi:hypothetical protein